MTDRDAPTGLGLGAWTETGTCEHHGPFENQRFGPPTMRPAGCPACADARQQANQRLWEQQRAESAAALEEDRHRERISASGLIGRQLRATFEAYDATTDAQRRVLGTCRDFAAGALDEWRTLWLIGTVGTGKTHLLSAMALATIARKRSATVITARDLVRQIRATWRSDAEMSEEQVIDRFARCGLLCIDELGLGFGTDGELLHLTDVLDARYRLERPTVIASNLDKENLRQALGDRLFDRLAENATVRACNWPSHRRA